MGDFGSYATLHADSINFCSLPSDILGSMMRVLKHYRKLDEFTKRRLANYLKRRGYGWAILHDNPLSTPSQIRAPVEGDEIADVVRTPVPLPNNVVKFPSKL